MLKDLFGLNIGAIVSITGAGGKTSLMFALSEELRKEHKVLVTTTTKIYMPMKEEYDFLYMLKDFISSESCGAYVLGKGCSEENKLIGLDCDSIDELSKHFDYTFIEADGSKRKPLKGWREDEPVICGTTNITIGVLDIKAVGLVVKKETVHRVDKFSKLTRLNSGEVVGVEQLLAVIFHPEGLFKATAGERILYINKVENEEDFNNLKKLKDKIKENNKGYLAKVVSGSIVQGKWEGEAL